MTHSVAVIPEVLGLHLEDAIVQRATRSVLVCAPQVQLHRLLRLDERLAANLDGLGVAGAEAQALSFSTLEVPSKAALFVSGVAAIQGDDLPGLERLLSLASAMPELGPGLLSALGWVEASALRGIAHTMLASADPFRRDMGLAACALHQTDPGVTLDATLTGSDDPATALQVATRLGRAELLASCVVALQRQDLASPWSAARSALLLGDRHLSVRELWAMAQQAGAQQTQAATLLLKALAADPAQALMDSLIQSTSSPRMLIRSAGACGDVHYIPWLIEQMQDPKLTRLAGESFSTLTGLDLAYLDLDRKPPEGLELGPTDDPEDEDVSMDEDEGLPWPDAEKISAWWQANSHRFTPGTRYFMGQPPSTAHCIDVLKNGYQRQRMAAAEYLCLLNPGTPLFNCAAPAWRQQRWLAKMGATA